MRKVQRFWVVFISILLAAAFIWYFSFILWYLFFAALLSMAGRPMVTRILSLKMGSFRISELLAALTTLIIIYAILGFVLFYLGSRILVQLSVISTIDYDQLLTRLNALLANTDGFLRQYRLLHESESLGQLLAHELRKIVEAIDLGKMLGSVFSMFGNFAIGLFSITFLTFFFLKEHALPSRLTLLFVPAAYEEKVKAVITQTRKLLTRYVAGLFAEVLIMIMLLSLGLWIAGIPNPLLLGTMGGVFNIIPYFGPLLGALLSMTLSVVVLLGGASAPDVFSVIFSVAIVFLAANMVDNFLLQPVIYSKSLRAHPVEVFLVILMAGTLGGISGMIMAMPVYSVLRIIGIEFFSGFEIMKKISGGLKA